MKTAAKTKQQEFVASFWGEPGCRRELLASDVGRIASYDPDTGVVTWNRRGAELFSETDQPSERKAAAWNARYAGKASFNRRSRCGKYLIGAIYGRTFFAHRIAWAAHFGVWPDGLIDHINGNGCDNRLVNLRVVDPTGNARNRRIRDDAASKRHLGKKEVFGVYWLPAKRRWKAEIFAKKKIFIGTYRTFDEAVAARKAAEKVLGFSSHHGTRADG